jgi:hypothetical protein
MKEYSVRKQEDIPQRKQIGSANGRRSPADLPPPHDQEAVRRLTELVESLLAAPPAKTQELEDRYQHIKDLIKTIESSRGRREFLEDLLSSIDTNFNRVRRTYPLLKPGFLDEVGTSLFATEYRFFVGGLESYLKKLAEISDATLVLST